jgi:hypothetical protein
MGTEQFSHMTAAIMVVIAIGVVRTPLHRAASSV